MAQNIVLEFDQDQKTQQARNLRVRRNDAIATVGVATVAGGALVLAQSQPAQADTIADLTTMVSGLTAFVGVVSTIVIAALTVRVGIKFFNRMATKG